MKFLWDERKRLATLAARHLDFAMVRPDFFRNAKVQAAKGGRFLALGIIRGTAYAVVFRPLGSEAVSIVSLRRASRRERRIL